MAGEKAVSAAPGVKVHEPIQGLMAGVITLDTTVGDLYILGGENGRTPVREHSYASWRDWMRTANQAVIVRETYTMHKPPQKILIVTKFLGLDHRDRMAGLGPPLVFGTRIYGGPLDGQGTVCDSWIGALRENVRWRKKHLSDFCTPTEKQVQYNIATKGAHFWIPMVSKQPDRSVMRGQAGSCDAGR